MGEFKMPSSFSPDLQNLIQSMLTVDPKKRISADEICNHAWITSNMKHCDHDEHDHHHHSEDIVKNLKAYKG